MACVRFICVRDVVCVRGCVRGWLLLAAAMLIHTVGVAALTQAYERVAEVLTDTEGLSRLAARNALIVKRVLFEFIDGE
jgi:hypothetical protein